MVCREYFFLFLKYLQNSCYVATSILDTRDTTANKTNEKSAIKELK